MANIEKCLFEGQAQKVITDKYGRKSQQIQIDGVCSVSINPDTGQLVQVNPF